MSELCVDKLFRLWDVSLLVCNAGHTIACTSCRNYGLTFYMAGHLHEMSNSVHVDRTAHKINSWNNVTGRGMCRPLKSGSSSEIWNVGCGHPSAEQGQGEVMSVQSS
jgi:hypothetical protein